MAPTLTRRQVLDLRVHAQQLGRASGVPADTAVLDLGVQDSGPDGGRWALALRGVPADDGGLSTVWTIRGAPHLYRRAEQPQVAADDVQVRRHLRRGHQAGHRTQHGR